MIYATVIGRIGKDAVIRHTQKGEAAAEFRQAKAEVDAATLAMKAAQERLIELSGGQSAKGAGVQVIKTERKGAIKYSEVVKELLPDTDLTPWQGESQTVYAVKVEA